MESAEPEDLIRELAYYAKIDQALPNGIELQRVLKSWTRQGGYPVVNVNRDKAGKAITFTQVRLPYIDLHIK